MEWEVGEVDTSTPARPQGDHTSTQQVKSFLTSALPAFICLKKFLFEHIK